MSEGTAIDVLLTLVVILGACFELAWFDYLLGYKFRASKNLDDDVKVVARHYYKVQEEDSNG